MNPPAAPSHSRVLVGAYAALPAGEDAQGAFYAGLAARRLASGLEIPCPASLDDLAAGLNSVAGTVRGRFTDSVLTLIPGTMVRVKRDGVFGLASPDADGRRVAVEYVRRAREIAEELNQRTGEASVTVLHIHSAPSVVASPEAFARSLGELVREGERATRLVVEHCDAYHPDIPGEKRFLDLDAEIPAVRAAGLKLAVNWGRSAVEAHDAARPAEHIATLAGAGLLAGIMFSGAGGSASQYGGPWADAHLPLADDEPTSLMTRGEVERCLGLAGEAPGYVGAKIQVPSAASVGERLDMIEHVTSVLTAGAGSAA